MYKVVATFLMIFMMLSSTRAATNTELIDAIDDLVEQKQTQQLTTTQDELAFDSFSSCEDMTSTLEDFVQDNFSDNRYGRGG
jgi:hypothetical protein